MAELPVYSTIEEKKEHFNIIMIETKDDYDKFIKEEPKTGIYRGVVSSKYKIYTSLQRQIIANSLGKTFNEEQYLKKFREEPILKKYFSSLKIEASKLSIYSYLQHYGAPTPFIDFTSNFEKALYFAIEKFDEASHIDNGSIDDYFSIFFINQTDLDLIEIPRVIRDLSTLKKQNRDFSSGYEDYSEEKLVSFIDNLFSDNTCNVFLINHYDEFLDVYNMNNSIRIIAQEGLFIHNNYLDKPLEEALKEFFKDSTQYIGSELDDINDPQIQAINEKYLDSLDRNRRYQFRLKENIITSFEIRKSLIKDIKKEFTLRKEDIYPDPEELCRQIFEKTISK